MIKKAVISECGLYRYSLTRLWDPLRPKMVFIMLNPSTADHEQDDPTIRRCISRARVHNCGSLEVVNLFAYRATNPSLLLKAEDPVGPLNDKAIIEATTACCPHSSSIIVVAWGTKGGFKNRDREVLEMLSSKTLYCLKKTNAGHPSHPLYISNDTYLKRYPGED